MLKSKKQRNNKIFSMKESGKSFTDIYNYYDKRGERISVKRIKELYYRQLEIRGMIPMSKR